MIQYVNSYSCDYPLFLKQYLECPLNTPLCWPHLYISKVDRIAKGLITQIKNTSKFASQIYWTFPKLSSDSYYTLPRRWASHLPAAWPGLSVWCEVWKLRLEQGWDHSEPEHHSPPLSFPTHTDNKYMQWNKLYPCCPQHSKTTSNSLKHLISPWSA